LLVTTNGRFVHLLNEEGINTACGANPHYYKTGWIQPWNGTSYIGAALASVTDAQARQMYACKKCQKKGMVIQPTPTWQAVVDASVALRKAVADRDNRKVYSEEDFYSKIDAVLDAVDALDTTP
jgi:hypothetical protein